MAINYNYIKMQPIEKNYNDDRYRLGFIDRTNKLFEAIKKLCEDDGINVEQMVDLSHALFDEQYVSFRSNYIDPAHSFSREECYIKAHTIANKMSSLHTE